MHLYLHHALRKRRPTEANVHLLKRLGQEEALLHVVVGGVGRVDVLHPREASTHPAVLVDGLQGAEEREEERKKGGGLRPKIRGIRGERGMNGKDKERETF